MSDLQTLSKYIKFSNQRTLSFSIEPDSQNINEHSTATNIMNLKHLYIVTILLDHGNIALVYSKKLAIDIT